MPDKISDYPVKTVIHDDDLMDLSNTEDSGSSYDQSQKLKVSAFMAYINSNVSNIYTTDDTILSNRTLDANGNFTKWLNGDVIVEEQNEAGDVSFLVQDVSSALMARLGYDNVNHSGILAVNDLTGTFFYANDGFVGVGTSTPTLGESFRVSEGMTVSGFNTNQFFVSPSLDFVAVGGVTTQISNETFRSAFHIVSGGNISIGNAAPSNSGLNMITNNKININNISVLGMNALNTITQLDSGSSDEIELRKSDDVVVMKVDGSSTPGDTRLFIYDIDNATLERVTVGAADSGGVGFKVLRINN